MTVEIRTEMIRAGRRTATGQARLFQSGSEALRATATFTDLSEAQGRTLTFAQPPVLPSPEQTIDLVERDGDGWCSLTDRLAYRVAELPGWRQGQPSGNPSAELWMQLTEGGDDDTVALSFLVDAAAAPVMEIGAISSTTVELTVHVRARPHADGSRAEPRLGSSSTATTKKTSKSGAQTGTLIAQSRQLAILRDPDQ